MVILEPTLVKSIAEDTVNNTGDNQDIEFDFAAKQGAKIEKIVISIDAATGVVAGSGELGINLRPNAGSPAASGDVFEDDDVIAAERMRDSGTAGHAELISTIFDFHDDEVYIVKDITAQIYAVGAVNRGFYCKIYYKNVIFSDAELGNVLRNY